MQTLPKPPRLTKDDHGPLSSKNGAIAAAIVTAAVAGLLIAFFLQQYRDDVSNAGVPTRVLVAQQSIEQGTSGDTAGSEGRFKAVEVPRDQLKKGAVTDAATLQSKVAKTLILPGQQLTESDFKPAGHGIITKLAAADRAISVSLDSAHGLGGVLNAGDHVDLLSGFLLDSSAGRPHPALRMLMQDVLVLRVPKLASGGVVGGGTNQTGDVTLRVSNRATGKVAFAADNGKLWIVLRPQNGANLERSSIVTLESILVASAPVRAGE